jgi:hypothetical protein
LKYNPLQLQVLKSYAEREHLLELEAKFLADENLKMVHGVELMEIYDRLDELGSDEAEVKAATILSGLGFSHEDQNRATKE